MLLTVKGGSIGMTFQFTGKQGRSLNEVESLSVPSRAPVVEKDQHDPHWPAEENVTVSSSVKR